MSRLFTTELAVGVTIISSIITAWPESWSRDYITSASLRKQTKISFFMLLYMVMSYKNISMGSGGQMSLGPQPPGSIQSSPRRAQSLPGGIMAPGTTWLKCHPHSCYCMLFLWGRLQLHLNNDTMQFKLNQKSKLSPTARYIQCKDYTNLSRQKAWFEGGV